MRVTQSMMTRQYLGSSNSALNNMNKAHNKVLTQRKFLRGSEDAVSASKALIIRRNMEKDDMYKANLETAEGIFSTAEKSLLTISKISTTVADSLLNGANGTNGQSELDILAKQIRNSANEMVRNMNAEFADRRLFGGTNNTTSAFAYDDATNTLTFNGVDINSENMSDFPNTESGVFTDVGLGISFLPDGNVDRQTVMDISLNGAKILGHGVDADGDPKNIISLSFEAARALEAGDSVKARGLVDKINASKSNMMVGITDLGNRQQAVDYSKERVENDKFSLTSAQQQTEGIDAALEITNYKVAEMAYNATLSMGSKIIPNSIFDFIR